MDYGDTAAPPHSLDGLLCRRIALGPMDRQNGAFPALPQIEAAASVGTTGQQRSRIVPPAPPFLAIRPARPMAGGMEQDGIRHRSGMPLCGSGVAEHLGGAAQHAVACPCPCTARAAFDRNTGTAVVRHDPNVRLSCSPNRDHLEERWTVIDQNRGGAPEGVVEGRRI